MVVSLRPHHRLSLKISSFLSESLVHSCPTVKPSDYAQFKPIMGTDGREGEGEVDNSHHLLTPAKFWENSRKISGEGIEILIL